MFSTLRTRFGIPGVISVIALVFAMIGGAWAASGNSDGGKATASAKAKKGPRGPRGPKGDPGPAGPQGSVGPAGAKGDTGVAGVNGKDGVSVTSTESANAIEGHCTGTGSSGKGGSKFVSASGVTYACNGKEGSPWTAGGTLPPGATETGTWTVSSKFLGRDPDGPGGNDPELYAPPAFFSISFGLPLGEAVEADNFHYIDTEGEDPADCPGTAAEPQAAEGQLCVYETARENMDAPVYAVPVTSGAVLVASASQTAQKADFFGFGTWAVTAE